MPCPTDCGGWTATRAECWKRQMAVHRLGHTPGHNASWLRLNGVKVVSIAIAFKHCGKLSRFEIRFSNADTKSVRITFLGR